MSDADNRNSDGSVRDHANGLGGTWEDPAVLDGVRRRSPQALERFFDTAFPYVYSLAHRLTGNREAAEDIAQDVFLKAYQAADRLEVDRSAKPWLTTITYNAFLDARRRAAARPETVEDGGAIAEQQVDPTTPEDVLVQKEREAIIESALRRLDDESRAIVLLRDYCGTEHADIAVIMGLSHAAVRKRYSRALERMGEIIRGHRDE